VDVSNCYSLGAISATCGGIVGGIDASYNNTPTIRITNCYGYDYATSANSRILAPSYYYGTQSGCYAPIAGWTDASANANLTAGTTPSSLTSGNPGTSWTSTATGTPYVLSTYNAQLYNPNSASALNSYTSSQGLFQSGYTYQIIYASQVNNIETIRVFAYQGSAPYYNSYNSNTFTITNSNGSPADISSSINSSNGVLSITLPEFIISANGLTQSVNLRYDSSGVIAYTIDQTNWYEIITTSWPVTITNTNPGSSSVLNVIVTEDLTISNTYGNILGYFISGSSYITFDGSGNKMNINSISNYPGLIQNGTSGVKGGLRELRNKLRE